MPTVTDRPTPTRAAGAVLAIAALSPLTTAGIAGVADHDAGTASGLVNVAHQLGGSLGLGLLVTVFAAAGGTGPDERHLLADRIGRPRPLPPGRSLR